MKKNKNKNADVHAKALLIKGKKLLRKKRYKDAFANLNKGLELALRERM